MIVQISTLRQVALKGQQQRRLLPDGVQITRRALLRSLTSSQSSQQQNQQATAQHSAHGWWHDQPSGLILEARNGIVIRRGRSIDGKESEERKDPVIVSSPGYGRRWPRHCFSSHSTQRVRPCDTGNPQALHFCKFLNSAGIGTGTGTTTDSSVSADPAVPCGVRMMAD